MDWAANLLGLDRIFTNASNIGGGVIQVNTMPHNNHFPDNLKISKTTASDSLLTAVVAARSRYQRNHPEVDMDDLVIYTTTQTHSLGAKAGLILGLKVKALEVRFEDKLSLRGATLRNALEEDISSGIHPFLMGKYLVPLTLDAGTISSFFLQSPRLAQHPLVQMTI